METLVMSAPSFRVKSGKPAKGSVSRWFPPSLSVFICVYLWFLPRRI